MTLARWEGVLNKNPNVMCEWSPTKAVSALRVGGRYLIAGMVTPGCDLGIDGNLLIRKCLTVKGIHNYRPGTVHI